MSGKKYRIRHKTTGKFIGGNKSYPRYFQWTDTGITWGRKPKLSEIETNLARMDDPAQIPDDLEIVEYELREVGIIELK